ncbi:hypothetical protein VNI00_004498 [Paramarasmius palmivorus]|uniref:Uncharacterized protein n=1 Tax=Paramarasmius palmivorus TaxID=297713 RepID=A0AAW0DJI6_9AGAR
MVPYGLQGNYTWNGVSGIVSRINLLVVDNNKDISNFDLSAMEKEIIEVTKSGNSNNTFNVNSNNSYSASYSDESVADTQSISLPQSPIPTNFENNDPRRSEQGFGPTEFSTTVPPSQNFQPNNRGVPPEIPDPIPPAIAGLSSLHETIQSVTGPLQSTTANLESITWELVTMNNTLKDIATALNKLANSQQNAQAPQSAVSGSGSRNEGDTESPSATEQALPNQPVDSIHIEPQRHVDREQERVGSSDLGPQTLPPPGGDAYNCFGFTLRRSSCHIC